MHKKAKVTGGQGTEDADVEGRSGREARRPCEVTGEDSRGEAPDYAGGRVKEGFLEEVALKPRQGISRGLADGRREGRVFQEGGTACANS